METSGPPPGPAPPRRGLAAEQRRRPGGGAGGPRGASHGGEGGGSGAPGPSPGRGVAVVGAGGGVPESPPPGPSPSGPSYPSPAPPVKPRPKFHSMTSPPKHPPPLPTFQPAAGGGSSQIGVISTPEPSSQPNPTPEPFSQPLSPSGRIWGGRERLMWNSTTRPSTSTTQTPILIKKIYSLFIPSPALPSPSAAGTHFGTAVWHGVTELRSWRLAVG